MFFLRNKAVFQEGRRNRIGKKEKGERTEVKKKQNKANLKKFSDKKYNWRENNGTNLIIMTLTTKSERLRTKTNMRTKLRCTLML